MSTAASAASSSSRPPRLTAATSDYRLPATQLYVVINTGLEPRIPGRRSLDAVDPHQHRRRRREGRYPADDRPRLCVAAKRSGIDFNVASIPAELQRAEPRPFDPDYMSALFQVGVTLGKSATPFASEPPAYPGRPTVQPTDTEKTGANR